MTLQKIADYAMNYLDSKGIAADYSISGDALNVSFSNKWVSAEAVGNDEILFSFTDRFYRVMHGRIKSPNQADISSIINMII